MRITPLAVPESGPYRMAAVNQTTGALYAEQIFEKKEDAIAKAQYWMNRGFAGSVYDAQGRCHEIFVKEENETEKD